MSCTMCITIPRSLPAVAQLVEPPPDGARVDGAVAVPGTVRREQRRRPRRVLIAERPRVRREQPSQLLSRGAAVSRPPGPRFVHEVTRVPPREVAGDPPIHR